MTLCTFFSLGIGITKVHCIAMASIRSVEQQHSNSQLSGFPFFGIFLCKVCQPYRFQNSHSFGNWNFSVRSLPFSEDLADFRCPKEYALTLAKAEQPCYPFPPIVTCSESPSFFSISVGGFHLSWFLAGYCNGCFVVDILGCCYHLLSWKVIYFHVFFQETHNHPHEYWLYWPGGGGNNHICWYRICHFWGAFFRAENRFWGIIIGKITRSHEFGGVIFFIKITL